MLIKLKQGIVQGIKTATTASINSYNFFGIPYAQPPINSLRFQAPQPAKPWNGVLDATKPDNTKICFQKNLFTRDIDGNEDCLYLNIQIPDDPKNVKTPKSVMYYVHGGGFLTGCGHNYSGDNLIENDVILVTVNYRLHVLGFLNLGLDECPGNVGLKDLVMGLKWVKENIAEFGGDPNNVTLFGESAGASCVGYLMISPLAEGLFHKVIMQSGHPFCSWSHCKDPLEKAVQLATVLGYSGDKMDRKQIRDFLIQIPSAELLTSSFKVMPKVNKSFSI